MAKMKRFAVEIETTVKTTIFVEARRPNGVVDLLSNEDEWRKATAWTGADEHDVTVFLGRSNSRIASIRAEEPEGFSAPLPFDEARGDFRHDLRR